MPAQREQLVADWRQRLCAAEAEEADASPQRAWLLRIRLRLYRILLSLYGSGDWRADVSAGPDGRAEPGWSGDTSAAEESRRGDETNRLPLAGKPAKSAGKISAVLKAVANAQEKPRPVGPLASGVTGDRWIAVTSQSANVAPIECATLLESRGIPTLLVGRGRDVVVQVPAVHAKKAIDLVDQQRGAMSYRQWRRWQRLWAADVLGLTVSLAPLVAVLAMIAAQVVRGNSAAASGELGVVFLGTLMACCAIGFLTYVMLPSHLFMRWLAWQHSMRTRTRLRARH